jgi:hypothetical protein
MQLCAIDTVSHDAVLTIFFIVSSHDRIVLALVDMTQGWVRQHGRSQQQQRQPWTPTSSILKGCPSQRCFSPQSNTRAMTTITTTTTSHAFNVNITTATFSS